MASGSYLLNRKKYGRPQAMLWSENPGTLVNGLYVPAGYEVDANVPEGTDPDLLDQFIILSDHNRSPLDFSIERIEQRERMINGRMRSYHVDDKISISTSWDLIPSRAFKQKPNWESDFRQAYIIDVVGDAEQNKITYSLASLDNPFVVGDVIDVTGTNVTGFNVKGKTITEVTEDNGVQQIVIAGSNNGTYQSGGLITISGVGISNIKDNFEYQYTVDGGAGGLDLLQWYESHPGSFWVFLAYDKFTNYGRDTQDYKHLDQYNEVVEMYISDFSYTVEKRGGIYDLWNVSISLEEV